MPLAQSGGSNVGSSQIIDNEIIDADINAAAAIKESKIDFGTGLDNSNMQENVLRIAEITITAAEMLNMTVTPKTLIDAPGAGKVIIISELITSLGSGTPYGGAASPKIRYDGVNTELLEALTNSPFGSTGDKIYYFLPNNSQNLFAGINKAIKFSNAGSAWVDGNIPVKMFIKYSILTL